MQHQCSQTCRTTRPYEPETWCWSCREQEAEDREANMKRWQEDARKWLERQHELESAVAALEQGSP